MEEAVKRPYHSPLRDRHAAATRGAILDAAHDLFLRDGYQATSVRKIAAAAGVSERTVYNAFTDKATVLYEVGARIVSGELASDEATTRDLASELQAETDPVARIAIAASWSRMIWEQGMLRFESMLLDAAATDPRAAEVAEIAWQHKYEGNRQLLPLVFPDYAGRDHDIEAALDVLFAIESAAFVRILIEDRGWSYDQYEEWLRVALRRLFLDGSV